MSFFMYLHKKQHRAKDQVTRPRGHLQRGDAQANRQTEGGTSPGGGWQRFRSGGGSENVSHLFPQHRPDRIPSCSPAPCTPGAVSPTWCPGPRALCVCRCLVAGGLLIVCTVRTHVSVFFPILQTPTMCFFSSLFDWVRFFPGSVRFIARPLTRSSWFHVFDPYFLGGGGRVPQELIEVSSSLS